MGSGLKQSKLHARKTLNFHRLCSVALLFLIISVLQFSYRAAADSFCDYDAGLIGTTAIGYVYPSELLVKEWDFQKGTCAIWTFADPDTDDIAKATLRQCAAFVHMPSQYVTVPHDTDLITVNRQLVQNDYFSLLVFDNHENAMQVKLRDGSSSWVRLARSWGVKDGLYIVGDRPQIEDRQPTETKFYSRPYLDAETSTPSYYGKVQSEFFSHPFFEKMQADGHFDPSDVDSYAASSISFGFVYDITAIIRDETHAEWFEVEERLEQGMGDEWGDGASQLDIQFPIQSNIIRKIYIPFRNQEGVVQTVFLPGPYCD